MNAALSSPTPSAHPAAHLPILEQPLRASSYDHAANSTRAPSPGPEPPVLDRSSTESDSPPPSGPSTPTSQHHSVVPAYPYNVVPVPQHYGPTPDDSGITTRLPSICVDYLSHDWAEEDTWASWKAMTRHKSEIANGVRLENASWRTWAKQRGNLKTISPETLNWLKDSDVTWLYGPLHTAVEAVPPPKQATTSDRLGLEPLRSLSDSKTVSKGATKENNQAAKKADPLKEAAEALSAEQKKNIKPILKYRSLSDILLPPGVPGSPNSEEVEHDFDGSDATISVHHARSDSHLVRLNSLNRKRRSPVHSPREQSPERGFASDASSGSANNKRHISFNHRVEQCIAVDSTEDNSRYSSLSRGGSIHGGSSSESDDGEDEVLTFKSSPRVANFGGGVHGMSKHEPHTIARLGPTTLKSVELYPAPSPAVFYPDSPEKKAVELPANSPPKNDAASSAGPSSSSYGQGVNTYSARGAQQGGARTASGRRPVSYSNNTPRDPDYEDDDEYAMGFDYPLGPDVGVSDSYDDAQYGSTHLIGGDHNGYQPGSADFAGNGASYSTSPGGSQYGGYPRAPQSAASPNKPQSSGSPAVAVASAGARGPHSPGSAKDAQPPKKSILKGRAREGSAEDGAIPIATRFGSPSGSNASSGSPSSGSYTPVASSGVVATAIPQHVRPGVRRTGSSDEGSFRQEGGRGRSASRGSSSSLERGMSADRRSSASISPSSYSPPTSTIGSPARTAIGNGGLAGAKRNSSYDSLASLGAMGAGSSSSSGAGSSRLGDLIEGSSESEAETIRQQQTSSSSDSEDEDELPILQSQGMRSRQLSSGSSDNAMIERVEDVSASIENLAKGSSLPATVIDDEITESPERQSEQDKAASPAEAHDNLDDITPVPTPTLASAARTTSPLAEAVAPPTPPTELIQPASPSAPLPKPGPTSPPLAAPTAVSGTRVGGAPRFRQPSPSAATTSTTAPDDDGSSTAVPSPAQLRSLSNSPALDPSESGEPKWSDEAPAPAAPGTSSARSSLLKAAKRSSSQHELAPATSRSSVEQRRAVREGQAGAGAHGPEDGFGYLDEEQDTGLVGRTLEVSRDLLGALGKGLWSLGGGKNGGKK